MRRPIRVTCFIDSLGPGGAQRQMSLLAVLLKRRGYDVDVLTYRPVRFFDSVVEEAGVPVRRIASSKLRGARSPSGGPSVSVTPMPSSPT